MHREFDKEIFEKYKIAVSRVREGQIDKCKNRLSDKAIRDICGNMPKKKEQEEVKKTEKYKKCYDRILNSDNNYKNLLDYKDKLTSEEIINFINDYNYISELYEKKDGRITLQSIDDYKHECYKKILENERLDRERIVDETLRELGFESLEELCESVWNEIEDELPERIEDYLLNEEQFVACEKHNRGYWQANRVEYEEIDECNYENFLQNSFPTSPGSCMSWNDYYNDNFIDEDDFYFDEAVERAGEKLYNALSKKVGEDCLDTIKGETIDNIVDIMCDGRNFDDDKLNKIFTIEYIDKLLRQNPNYSSMFEDMDYQKESERQLRENILDKIPDDYVDMFPDARLMNREFVLHVGPTNSGKTYSAMQDMYKYPDGIYLAPLRLLAFEQFESANSNGHKCNLLTGEEEIMVDDATYQSSTIEMLDLKQKYSVAVIDECQMLDDEFRGGAWISAILGVRAEKIHLCLAPYALDIIKKLIESCGDTYTVETHERLTKLELDTKYFAFPESVKKGDALIVFSKRSIYEVASELQNIGIKCSVIYGALPYDVRHKEAKRFETGESDVVVATDAIGMGMNLPIKRVVFLETEKYDGRIQRQLIDREIQQIAGRAGRAGIFDVGAYNIYGTKSQKKAYGKLMEKEIEQIENVCIDFPEHLINLDAPLSDILTQWEALDFQNIYQKTSCGREIRLALKLEEYTDDKKLIYDFITIPFNEDNPKLYDYWFLCFKHYIEGTKIGFITLALPNVNSQSDLEEAESIYAFLDMEYYIVRKFGDHENLPKIMKQKAKISERISAFLAKQKFKGRTCSICGKKLPWKHPYGRCAKCHSQIVGRYHYDDYDYDEDWY